MRTDAASNSVRLDGTPELLAQCVVGEFELTLDLVASVVLQALQRNLVFFQTGLVDHFLPLVGCNSLLMAVFRVFGVRCVAHTYHENYAIKSMPYCSSGN